MNADLRFAYTCNHWSIPETILEYFRERECFEGLGGQKKANPHWYGTIVLPNQLNKVAAELIENKSIRLSRMVECVEGFKTNLDSPIVRLVGIFLDSLIKKYTLPV